MDRPTAPSTPVLVWDLPTRLFHWLMAASFAGAWITAEGERWRLVHVTLGYTMAGLIAFRLAWGLVGSRHARFSDFVRGPAAVVRYLKSMLAGRPEHHVGHNPLGAVAIVAMLALGAGIVASGWALYEDIGGMGHGLEEVHEAAASVMLAVVAVHLLGVISGSLLHRENLARAMITGRKAGAAGDAIGHPWRPVGALMLAAVVGFWWLQWHDAPAGGALADGATPAKAVTAAGHESRRHSRHDDDD